MKTLLDNKIYNKDIIVIGQESSKQIIEFIRVFIKLFNIFVK